MVKLVSILFALLFAGCAHNPPHIIEVNRFIKEYSSSQKKEGFFPFGTGGAFHKQINELFFDLLTPGINVTVEEARKVLVIKTEELLCKINQDEQVRPYLKDFPFSEKNLYFTVGFMPSTLVPNAKEAIVMAGVSRGSAFYCVRGERGYDDVHEESYATAYEIVYGCPLPDRLSQVELTGHPISNF
jgi:hypothetical protein